MIEIPYRTKALLSAAKQLLEGLDDETTDSFEMAVLKVNLFTAIINFEKETNEQQ